MPSTSCCGPKDVDAPHHRQVYAVCASLTAHSDVTWLKDVAPSTELRKWFDHRPDRWEQFRTRYAAELDRNSDTVAKLRAICVRGRVTLLYSARDVAHNQALVLAEYLC